jgi:thiol-disulfide isomerase/thioredoxin
MICVRLSALLMLTAAVCIQPLQAADLSKLKPWTGDAAPKLSLKDLDGKPHDLAQYRGKVVVLNFWATWCAPCVKEMPALQRLADRLAGEKFVLITVNFGESETQIRPFIEKLGVRFPVWIDRDMSATQAWVDKGLPTTFVIDSGQKIRYRVLGDFEWDTPRVEARIRALLPKS